MKKWSLLIMLAVFCTLIAACSSEKPVQQTLDFPALLIVTAEVPETASPGEEVTLGAVVTQDDMLVERLDDMYFEIWRKGQKAEAVELDGEFAGEGRFVVNYAFPEDGVYYIVAHSTLGVSHTMPRKMIAVGTVTAEELEDDERNYGMDEGRRR